jgi:hypothetical protein
LSSNDAEEKKELMGKMDWILTAVAESRPLTPRKNLSSATLPVPIFVAHDTRMDLKAYENHKEADQPQIKGPISSGRSRNLESCGFGRRSFAGRQFLLSLDKQGDAIVV